LPRLPASQRSARFWIFKAAMTRLFFSVLKAMQQWTCLYHRTIFATQNFTRLRYASHALCSKNAAKCASAP